MTSPNADVLFQPFKVKSLEMQNRIVMAPMTRTFSPGGVPRDNVAEYYRRRAAGDVGLILTEGTVVERPASKNEEAIPNFFGNEALSGWKQVVDGVHAAGGKIGPQIWHTGSTRNARNAWVPAAPVESPSGLKAPGKPRGNVMSEEDIADTIAAFARASADAKRLGFDMAEIHGAHGYLIDQFFWSGTNERSDKWGGETLPERARFAAEIIKEMRAAVGEDFPIVIRVSQWKQQDYKARLAPTPEELEAWLTPLIDAGADVLHCSQRRFWEPEFPHIDGDEGLNFAGWVKKVTGAPTISVGSVGLDGEFFGSFRGEDAELASLEKLITRMEREEFDLIAVGRILISNPNWVRQVRGDDIEPIKAFQAKDLFELV